MIVAEFKTNVMRILEKEKIPYKAHEYPHGKEAVDGVSVARLLGQDPSCVFKTLVTKGSGRDYYVFVVPVDKELDLKKCAASVGEQFLIKHSSDIHFFPFVSLGLQIKVYTTPFEKSTVFHKNLN